MSRRLARKLDPDRVRVARLGGAALGETAPDVTDAVDDAVLAETRKRWGLDAVPTTNGPPKRREMARVTVQPAALARELLAIRPPSDWERELREVSPKSEAHSWLRFAWMETPREAKTFRPDQGRWVLYECIPDGLLSGERRFQLQTPYWELPKGMQMGRSVVATAFQFELYKAERVDARPYWILQGDRGGTPCAYTALDTRLLQAAGQPADPPARGALPYAPWDGRVRDAIARNDRLVALSRRIEALRATASADALRAEADAAEEAYRRARWAWWAEQMEESADFLAWYTRKTEADRTIRRLTSEEARAMADAEERYITTGTF